MGLGPDPCHSACCVMFSGLLRPLADAVRYRGSAPESTSQCTTFLAINRPPAITAHGVGLAGVTAGSMNASASRKA